MKLRLTKCSQYKKDAILWQVSPLEKDSNLPDKFYLVISYHKEAGQYLRFTRERPALSWDASGTFSALVRKYMNSAVLSEILVDADRRNVWVPLQSGGQVWMLHIHHEGAVEISLVSPENVSVVRLGAKGVFTKKKEASALPEREGLSNIIDELVEEKGDTRLPPTKGDSRVSPFSHFQREARRRLARRLKTVRQASEKLSKGFKSEDDIAALEKQAHLLSEDWNAVDNVSEHFERLKKMKKGQSALRDQLAKAEAELRDLEFENSRLQTTQLSEDELVKILRRFRLPIDKPQAAPVGEDKNARPYKIYKSDGVDILVGKGPHENDELTKSARSNDYWFHAIGLGGSHVIVPYQQVPKSGLTQKVKRDASILALHFSKVRKDLAGELYVTQRRCLTKKKGMPPGLWLVQQSETFYVSYTEEELKAILGSGTAS